MVFSSLTFLFVFLPLTIFCYFLAGSRGKNFILLTASLLFYAWGEAFYVFLMLGSIAFNYTVGLLLNKAGSKKTRQRILAFGVAINILSLGFFKYTNWLVDTITGILPSLSTTDIITDPIHLPIGISFFTFQALSYIIDVYRNETESQKNPFHLGLYIASFPQLIAGPIVRYNQVAAQIVERQHSFKLFAEGVERFIYGLSKKVLIANPMAAVADRIFAQNYDTLSPELAWLGILCYTLQIFFDFSGYSDMAIGLGKMFGFHFPENFNFPYIARSMQDFWKRWHISLSTWFRDYLYIPLGGNQKGKKRTYQNLFTVFVLCGLWHGASWNFLIWGLLHGTFLVLERNLLKKILKKAPRILAHTYTLFVVVHAWIFFRVEDLGDAFDYLGAMYFLNDSSKADFNVAVYSEIDRLFLFSLILGVVFATPVIQTFLSSLRQRFTGDGRVNPALTNTIRIMPMFSLLYLCISFLAVNSYNPFIYFRF